MIIEVLLGLVTVSVGVAIGGQVCRTISQQKLTGSRDKVRALEKENELLKDSSEFWSNEYLEKSNQMNACEEELRKYKRAYAELARERAASSDEVSAEVREAIKFAMVNSHPDKPNGSQEEFIKFHKLYKRYYK